MGNNTDTGITSHLSVSCTATSAVGSSTVVNKTKFVIPRAINFDCLVIGYNNDIPLGTV